MQSQCCDGNDKQIEAEGREVSQRIVLNMIKCTYYFAIIIHKSNQIKSNVKFWFLMRGENRSTRGKTSHGRVEHQQTQSTYDTEWATLVEGKCAQFQFTIIHYMGFTLVKT